MEFSGEQGGESTKSALFVIDDANYRGGAQLALARLLKALYVSRCPSEVLSGVSPTAETRQLFSPVRIRHVPSGAGYAQWFDQCGFREVLSTRGLAFSEKLRKLKLSLSRRLGLRTMPKVADTRVDEGEEKVISEYPCVCVMSEGSRFRAAVANLPASVRKVQLIHTFYTLWRDYNDWTRHLTAGDGALYSKMDAIGLIGTENVRAFGQVYPHLAQKSHPFHNVIDVRPQPVADAIAPPSLRLVTVARLESEKDVPRMIRIARRLVADGLHFIWTVYGDGSLRGTLEEQLRRSGLGTTFRLAGYDADAVARMREADLFILLSHYEGLPNVIYESMIVGTPVLATAVGGIPEQIDDGVNGRLVADDVESIYQAMKAVMSDPQKILQWRRNLRSYAYDNDRAIAEFRALLLGEKT